MRTAFRIISLILTYVSCIQSIPAANIDRWQTDGTSFYLEFEAHPICVDTDTLIGIPRGEITEISLYNQKDEIFLSYKRQFKGIVNANKVWSLTVSLVDRKFAGQWDEYYFSGTAETGGETERCLIKVIKSDKSFSNMDTYQIKIGRLGWASGAPTDSFYESIEPKKVQHAFLDCLLRKDSKSPSYPARNNGDKHNTYKKPKLTK